MEGKDLSKLKMIRTVLDLCNNHDEIVSTNVAFKTNTSVLSNKIDEIISVAGEQGKVITGITTDKNVAKDEVVQAASDLAGLVFAYASGIKNNTLKEAVDFSHSHIDRLKGDLLVSTCNNIYDNANDNLAALYNSGVSDDLLAAFEVKIETYSKSLPAPRIATSEKGTHTSNLKQLIREAILILKEQMDKLVVNFKDKNPDFVSSYFNARIVIFTGVHPSKVGSSK